MMMKRVIVIAALLLIGNIVFAQDRPLEISGSADVYYKYDLAKKENIRTSFASDQNSVSLGMLDIALKKTTGKASFVGEISFGPRGQYQSVINGDGADNNSFHIQNLYVSYAITEKTRFTAGFMGTFIGYEVISPVSNFHYSTSYLFTNGPFQNAGVKIDYLVSNKISVMVGAFNDSWNSYKANSVKGLNAVGFQVAFTPADGIRTYLNFMHGSVSGTIVDLTASFKLVDNFKVGLNAADFSNNGKLGYTGLAMYPEITITKKISAGVRGEYFKFKESSGADSVTAFTLTANLKAGGLTFIPEIRLDKGSNKIFVESNGNATKAASQVSLAMVYGF